MRWSASTRSIYAARIYGDTNPRLSVSRNCQRNIVPRSNSIPFSLFKFPAECWIADRPVKCTASSRVNTHDRDNFLLFSIHPSYRPKRTTNRFIPWECDSIFSRSSLAVRDKERQRFRKKIYIYYFKILYHESRRRQTTITHRFSIDQIIFHRRISLENANHIRRFSFTFR